MNEVPTGNTKAILLLTAPLIVGRGGRRAALLSPREYRALAAQLRAADAEPADLLEPDAYRLIKKCSTAADNARLNALLGRGFLLSQALGHWQARSIHVVSREDEAYPRRLRERLKQDAPILLYSCGEIEILGRSALAVVGPRNASEPLIQYAQETAALAARAGRAVVSGSAKGIDQAAMNGALEAGGSAIGVLAGGLERTAMNRDHRNLLLDGRLVLVSPFDPRAPFRVGYAMQRNKLIYAMADAALVVDAKANSGGTWAGAIEQLQKYKGTVYVRSSGSASDGIEALQSEGAIPWPNPADADRMAEAIDSPVRSEPPSLQDSLFSAKPGFCDPAFEDEKLEHPAGGTRPPDSDPNADHADELYRIALPLMLRVLSDAKKPEEFAKELGVTTGTARFWIKRLAADGIVVKNAQSAQYVALQNSLFENPTDSR